MGVNPTTTYTGNKVDPRDFGLINGNFEPQLQVGAGTILGRVTAASASERQTIDWSGGADVPTGGTFKLGITGIDGGTYWTDDLDYNISNANLKIALDALLDSAGYEGATVTIGGGACPVDVTVDFGGTAAYKHMPLLQADITNITSGGIATCTPTLTTRGKKQGDWAVYTNADALSLGLSVARGIAAVDFRTDYFGRVVFSSDGSKPQNGVYHTTAPIWTRGDFLCSELTGLDSSAIGDLGRLINAASATDTGAILRVY